MKKRRRLSNSRGFTLIEAVVTTLIMSIMAMAITVGTRGSIMAYQDSLFVSEGDMLVSNLEIAVGDVLRFASYTQTDGTTGTVHFNNEDYGAKDGFFLVKDGILYLQATNTGDPAVDKQSQLLNSSSYTEQRIADFTMTYDPVNMIFEGQYKMKSQVDASLEREVKFCFRTLRAATPPSPI